MSDRSLSHLYPRKIKSQEQILMSTLSPYLSEQYHPGANNISHAINDLFTCMCSNKIYTGICQQCLFAIHISRTGLSQGKRIKGHKLNVKNGNWYPMWSQQNPGNHYKSYSGRVPGSVTSLDLWQNELWPMKAFVTNDYICTVFFFQGTQGGIHYSPHPPTFYARNNSMW